jgi:hypothetical protein
MEGNFLYSCYTNEEAESLAIYFVKEIIKATPKTHTIADLKMRKKYLENNFTNLRRKNHVVS